MRIEQNLITCQFLRVRHMIQITVVKRRMGQLTCLEQRLLAGFFHSFMPYVKLGVVRQRK